MTLVSALPENRDNVRSDNYSSCSPGSVERFASGELEAALCPHGSINAPHRLSRYKRSSGNDLNSECPPHTRMAS